MFNDLIQELSTNFIEYAAAVNSDRAIPNAADGLKPVAKRILFGAYDCGFKSEKPHVKCANIVGNVMADFHPHGDTSIYDALVRLSQKWVMRYPLIDFHGSNGNIDGDGPAAYRYTEAKLSKFTEEGLLSGIKKNNVAFVPNYSETKQEPIELPSIFPNLLCNPNSGIGVAIASNWGCANLKEVAQAIFDYLDGKEPMIYPDFPTGGTIINKKDIPQIMRTGHGSVKIRGKYEIDKNKIIFTEIPYGVRTEALMTQIGELCDSGEITGITDIRNESNKKGFRLVIECDKNSSMNTIITKLFAKSNLQTSFSYNQVALVDKTPTLLNLKDCIEIYIKHNTNCIQKEAAFDIEKTENRLHIINGLLKALDIIDEVIQMIKRASSSAEAKVVLQEKWGFSEVQAKAILDMKLSKLAKLEKEELITEKTELENLLIILKEIYNNPIPELRKRLSAFVTKYGDERRTTLENIADVSKEEKEIEFVEPEKVVVVLTESGSIKRIPASSYRTQRKNGKGIKTQNDITSMVLRTNTVDQLMVFSNKGNMYRLLVDNIPTGTNSSNGTPVTALVPMEVGEKPTIVYSIYRDTKAKYVLFTTKKGLVKKTLLEEYIKTKKKAGLAAISLNEGDELVSVNLVEEENLILLTKLGMGIRIGSTDIPSSGRTTKGLKGITLKANDEVVCCLPIRDDSDDLAIFFETGNGKRINLKELPLQSRAGKGLICHKNSNITAASLVSNDDVLLVCGDKNSICVQASDITIGSRGAIGTQIIKNNHIQSVSKV